MVSKITEKLTLAVLIVASMAAATKMSRTGRHRSRISAVRCRLKIRVTAATEKIETAEEANTEKTAAETTRAVM